MSLDRPATPEDDRLLRLLTRAPMRSRGAALATLACLIAAIGWVDWLTATRISLTVFYLIPVALAVAWLGRWCGIAAACGCVGVRLLGDFWTPDYASDPTWIWWNAMVALAVFLTLALILARLKELYLHLESRVASRTRALEESVEARKRIESELRDAGSRERAAIGRDIHDDLGQHLVATAFAAKVLHEQALMSGTAAAGDIQHLVGMVETAIAKTRALARGLLVATLAPEDLPAELAELARRSSTSGLVASFRQEGRPAIADARVAAQLFRIAQEAVRNAAQHAHASRIEIVLSGEVLPFQLTIEDDGVGMPPPDRRGPGVGLRIMQHRATVIGATLAMTPGHHGRGTRISCLSSPDHAPQHHQ